MSAARWCPTCLLPPPLPLLLVSLRARSTWVTINTETRKPAKIPAEVKQRFRQLAHEGHTIPTKETRRKLPEFVWPAQLTAPSQLGRRSDMDPNGHINNVAYLAWAMEVIPQATYEGYQLTEVRVAAAAAATAAAASTATRACPLPPPAPLPLAVWLGCAGARTLPLCTLLAVPLPLAPARLP